MRNATLNIADDEEDGSEVVARDVKSVTRRHKELVRSDDADTKILKAKILNYIEESLLKVKRIRIDLCLFLSFLYSTAHRHKAVTYIAKASLRPHNIVSPLA